jgi:tripartite-type tricarboxylate transporter receptor subunit TctC
MQRRSVLSLLAAVSGATMVRDITAQSAYPERTIQMIFPYAAGGAADVFGRALAEKLRADLGRPVVAESKPGAGGAIGCSYVARAKPDGYTLLLGATGATLITPYAIANPGFDPVKDFESIGLLTRQAMTFVVSPNFPANNLREAVNVIRANPGKYNYASAGTGALAHLGMEFFKLRAGSLRMEHVPYKGGAPAMTDVMAGHVPMLLENFSQIIEHHKAGRVKALAILAESRSPLLPDVPTAIEQGFPGMDVQTSYVLMAPRGTPGSVLDRLDRAVRKTVNDPEFIAFGAGRGIQINSASTPALANEFVLAESRKWSNVIRSIGFKA